MFREVRGELESWETKGVELPLKVPFGNARFEIRSRSILLVRVKWQFKEGEAYGVGEVAPLPGWSVETLEECEAVLGQGDLWEGGWSDEVEALPALRAGLEMSRLLAVSTVRGKRVSALFGEGAGRRRISVQKAIGSMGAAEALEKAEEAIYSGYSALKIKVGGRPMEEEIEKVGLIRRDYPDVLLRLDCNQAYEWGDALRLLEAVEGLEIDLIEEPFKTSEFGELQRLARETQMPLGADELLRGHREVQVEELLGLKAVVLKPMSLGGVDRAYEFAEVAVKAGGEAVLSTLFESALGRQVIAELGAGGEFFRGPQGLSTGSVFEKDVFEDPVKGGYFDVEAGRKWGKKYFEGRW